MKKTLFWMSLVLAMVMLLAGCMEPAATTVPTTTPTNAPTTAPTTAPTMAPTTAPTKAPTTAPTEPNYPDAPDFTVYDLDGNEVKLSDFFGKPIVLNFWASWCGPCKAEMPEFQKKYSLIGDEVQFLMINVGDDMETAHKYVTKQGFQFPVFYDTNNNASEVYQISSIPMSYFINSEGKIVAQWLGTIDATRLNAYINLIRNK